MVAADSGYLSDLVETASRNNAAAARQLESSSTSSRTALAAPHSTNHRSSLSSRELIMSTFDDDTRWDVKTTGAKLALINKQCRLLEKRIKKPTRFPITPLPTTLARARARAILRQERLRREEFLDSQFSSGAGLAEEFEAVDGYGRTRAAYQIIGKSGAMMERPSRLSGREQEKGGLKRKRSQHESLEEGKVQKERLSLVTAESL